MIVLETAWRPMGSISTWSATDVPEDQSAPSSILSFPPENRREAFELQHSDAWAGILGFDSYGAFMSLGPAGDRSGNGEPAAVWQRTIALLNQSVLEVYGDGEVAADIAPTDLIESVKAHLEAGNLTVEPDRGLQIRASTLSAYLEATALSDMHAKRELGTCRECQRRFVRKKGGQTFCSTRCRMRGHRASKKGEG